MTKKYYGRTEGWTDGMTDRCKPVYPPLFQGVGIIRVLNIHGFGKDLFIRFNVRDYRESLSVCVCASFLFGFEVRN